ncbi:uncharacterized protein K452DRAFT_224082 [Aplosporella prunicola CBS 121167]|uniref:OTU domain-containing protein n=1 Tax=Aplosporella prunicola CBS 121167 TaxID=1176127 RepID=A0A6A6BK00_9PEZI|nr:uncharacterized protein K452DRAFT_224082 [Aplosporella prunicola CBS 121167]KAF2143665.1 hypothetical protein K452DRAFT_224082 [Aplosporella prunicola CBS 121167]
MPSRNSDDEFPLLAAMGLYAADILGDGNCLFNALSDQMYGDPAQHLQIRLDTVQHMRSHADYYKQFIVVNPGGGTRRNPKRKNVGTYSAPAASLSPTPDEIDHAFEQHLESMARGGTWGDNIEIQAFAETYNLDVKIYQRDFAYVISPKAEADARQVLHIAYHNWEHYSSIRNLNGPHTGPPEVRMRAISPGTEQKQKERLANTSMVLPWQIEVVSKSLPFLTDKLTIKKALEECKGDVNNAVSQLLDDDAGNTSSAQESSSIEREPDSDDDDIYGPNKRRERRLNRATKHKSHQDRLISHLAAQDGSQLSTASTDSPRSSGPGTPQSTALEAPDSDDEQPSHSDAEEPPAPPSPKPQQGPRRIRLTMPRPPEELAAVQAAAKTQQKQLGPQQTKKVSARQQKDMKKQAQKAARKERQKAASKSPATTTLPIITKSNGTSPPTAGIKELYV